MSYLQYLNAGAHGKTTPHQYRMLLLCLQFFGIILFSVVLGLYDHYLYDIYPNSYRYSDHDWTSAAVLGFVRFVLLKSFIHTNKLTRLPSAHSRLHLDPLRRHQALTHEQAPPPRLGSWPQPRFLDLPPLLHNSSLILLHRAQLPDFQRPEGSQLQGSGHESSIHNLLAGIQALDGAEDLCLLSCLHRCVCIFAALSFYSCYEWVTANADTESRIIHFMLFVGACKTCKKYKQEKKNLTPVDSEISIAAYKLGSYRGT